MSLKNKWTAVRTILAALVIASWGACSASNDEPGGDDDDSSSEVSTGPSTGGSSGEGGSGAGGSSSVAVVGSGGGILAPPGTLEGHVYAPEGTVPISGALVYATQATPDEIPQQVFCDTCVMLEQGEPFTKTEADGSFSFEVPTGNWNLVVQKGAFRRVRPITVAQGTTQVDPQLTRFPSVRDVPNGDEIPRIAVLQGVYDPIDQILMSFGVGTVDVFTDHNSFIDNPTLLSDYHIIFLPCITNFQMNPTRIANLRNFVEAGGSLYATDLSSFVIEEAFQQENALDFTGFAESWQPVFEPELNAWLQAQNVNTAGYGNTLATNITQANNYIAPDEEGMTMQMFPTLYVGGQGSSGTRPKTASFQYGCGKVLFSTYHTEEFSTMPGFSAEELVLFHIILEVAECIGEIEPPE